MIPRPLLCLSMALLAQPLVAAEGHWLEPLRRAAEAVILDDPAVKRQDLERERAALGLRQADADWNPLLRADAGLGQSVERTNDANEVATSSETLIRPLEDYEIARQLARGQSPTFFTTPGVNDLIPTPSNPDIRREDQEAGVAIEKNFSTGTDVTLRASTRREEDNRINSLSNESWVSRLRLTISQELLRGSRRMVNEADIATAKDDMAEASDDLADAVEDAFAELIDDWLDLARVDGELADAKRSFSQSEEEVRILTVTVEEGLDRASELVSRKRDLIQQRSSLRRLERERATILLALAAGWPGLELPEAPLDRQAVEPAAVAFTNTREGNGLLRSIDAAKRQALVADDRGRDRLTLEAGVGLSGRDPEFGDSWQTLGTTDNYDWSVDLTWERRLGSDRARLEGYRARLTGQQAELDLDAAHRDWQVQSAILARELIDAEARAEEAHELAEALREEAVIVAARFDTGLVDIRELLQVQAQVRSGERDVIRARIDALRAEVALRRHTDQLHLPLIDGDLP